MKKKKRIVGNICMILSLVFFYLPIVCVVVFSFNGSKSLTVMKGFSLQWYERLFKDSQMMESVYTTVLVAVIATVVSTVLVLVVTGWTHQLFKRHGDTE